MGNLNCNFLLKNDEPQTINADLITNKEINRKKFSDKNTFNTSTNDNSQNGIDNSKKINFAKSTNNHSNIIISEDKIINRKYSGEGLLQSKEVSTSLSISQDLTLTPKIPQIIKPNTKLTSSKFFKQVEYTSGLNTRKYENGEEFYGNFNEFGKLNGLGKYKTNDSASNFQGYFVDDIISGFGIENWVDGSSFIGEYKNNMKDGYGILTLDDGSYYEGQFKDNDINGYGSFYKKDGSIQKGYFIKNKIDRYVIANFSENKIYEGEFWKDRKEGFGILYDTVQSQSKIWIGIWKKSKLESEGIIIENKTIKKYLFQNSKRVKLLLDTYKTNYDSIAEKILKELE